METTMAETHDTAPAVSNGERPGIQQIVGDAKAFLAAVLDEPLTDLRLEEIERNDAGDKWRVTLGYDRVLPSPLTKIGIPSDAFTRVYRVVTVDAYTGAGLSVKMRDV
jgi:hypothetical protein